MSKYTSLIDGKELDLSLVTTKRLMIEVLLTLSEINKKLRGTK